MEKNFKEEIDNCIHNIKEVFGPGKRCLGKDWRINFEEEKLHLFVEQMEPGKRLFLSRLLGFFWYYMRPLYLIQNGVDSLDEILGKTAWSTFALVTMMSVLDSYTKGNKYKRKEFIELLNENLPITSEEQLKKLSDIHKKTEPHPSIKRLCDLLKNNLEKEEINQIIKNYLSEKRSNGELKLKSLEDVIGHLWGEIRSDFIHNIGVESVYNESTTFSINKDKPDTIIVYNNLSMSNFLYLSWKAIFRDLGYKGDLNPKFTKEEMKNRQTVEGTKI